MGTAEGLERLIYEGEQVANRDRENKSISAKAGLVNLYPIGQSSGNGFYEWANDVKIFATRSLHDHESFNDLMESLNRKSHDEIQGLLRSIRKDEVFLERGTNISGREQQYDSARIFIVHGHDNEAKVEVARLIEQQKLQAIILHEQPDLGLTIIEKIEKYGDVGFAIILYTPCDEGKIRTGERYNDRARQNVVFEHGYFLAKLGRDRVCALVKGDIERPSDLDGILYTQMEGDWKYRLIRELKSAGYAVSEERIS